MTPRVPATRAGTAVARTLVSLLVAMFGAVTGAVGALALVARAVLPRHGAQAVRRATGLDATRLGERYGVGNGGGSAAFLAVRAVVGPAGGLLVLAGTVLAAVYWVWPLVLYLRGRIQLDVLAVCFGVAVASGVVAWQLSVGLVAFDRWLARRLLGADQHAELERRVAELSISRAAVVDVVDGERRRIERDLHDGIQQRLVALGMLLGRARRAGEGPRARALLVQAHEETGHILADLREVVWRVYPALLDQEGLMAALHTLADRSQIPVQVRGALPAEPPASTARAAYFLVSEALTNISRHAAAHQTQVEVDGRDGALVVKVTDDGIGGADPTGSGLSGLARRIAAVDGNLSVVSPVGGGTQLTAVMPCG